LPPSSERSIVPASRFEPCGAVRYNLDAMLDLSVEYYADLGPVSGFDASVHQQRYVFEAVDVIGSRTWTFRVGLGEGLTSNSNPITITTIVGHYF
jgi:hypothetical protein